MKTEQAKTTLTAMIKHAMFQDTRGAVVDRDQILRNISDLPLPPAYIKTALKRAQLLF